jgi:hypothetical protein
MTNDLPLPPVPADADLQDFPFMPLQVARLRDSDFAAEEEPEACWYAVLLWAASWHQIPAGSLPDNDTVLRRLCGLGRDTKTWQKHKNGALRGFFLCSDGRFYHNVVSEQVNEAWQSKLAQRHRSFCGAVRKHNDRRSDNILEIPTFDEWVRLDRPEKVVDLITALGLSTIANVAEKKRNVARTKDNVAPVSAGNGLQGTGTGTGTGIYIRESPNGLLGEAETSPTVIVPPDEPVTPGEIMKLWNELAYETGLSLVEKMTPDRRSKCQARIKSYPERKHWQQAFQTIRASSFLRGEGQRGWKADFDFLIQAKSFNRLVEGSYGNAETRSEQVTTRSLGETVADNLERRLLADGR